MEDLPRRSCFGEDVLVLQTFENECVSQYSQVLYELALCFFLILFLVPLMPSDPRDLFKHAGPKQQIWFIRSALQTAPASQLECLQSSPFCFTFAATRKGSVGWMEWGGTCIEGLSRQNFTLCNKTK